MKNDSQSSAVAEAPEPLLTIQSAGRYLNVNEATLRRWIKDGKLKARRIPGGSFRLRTSDLDAILA